MAPIEKLSDGRSTCLGWPLLNGSMQQPTERWFWRWDGRWRGDSNGRNVWGWTFTHRFGWRMMRRKKIEMAMGPWILMAFPGWEDTTTNRKAVATLVYNIERWRAER